MFVITQNNHVVLGPMRWNRYRFENFLEEEHEVSTSLPNSNESDVVVVNEEFKIYPIKGSENPVYDSNIEILHGPFWTFTETHAVSSYQVMRMSIESVKSFLKQKAAEIRWTKENIGIKLTIQGTEVSIGTGVSEREKFIQTYLLKGDNDTVQWKFKESWITLTKPDLKTIVDAIDLHIQSQFSWEISKVNEIDTLNTHEELTQVSFNDNPYQE